MLVRAAVGGLFLACGRAPLFADVPVVGAALRWDPLRLGVWALGILTLGSVAYDLWRIVKRTYTEPDPAKDVPLAHDLAAFAVLATGGIAAMQAWRGYANPESWLSGYDYNTYALNAIAASTGEWDLYNPDKRVFHARLVSWLAHGDAQRAAMVTLSVVCIGLFPAVTYALGRRATGRTGALLAALLTFACPLPWAFATQTTSYPLFYLLVVASLGATLWAVQRPRPWSVAIAALLAGVSWATQEKTPLTVAPVLGLAVLLRAPDVVSAVRATPVRTVVTGVLYVALAGALVVGILDRAAPPKRYTPFVSLVTNQREEMHRDVPYAWPVVKQPDVTDPAGVRAWLPTALQDGEVESWLAAVRTPPNSNSLRLAREPQPGKPLWTVAPETTIAPVELRWKVNAANLPNVWGPLPYPGAVLVGVGALALLLFAPGPSRAAFGLVGAAATGLAPLTLKFGEHYFPHLAPIAAVLAVAGWDRLVEFVLPGRRAIAGRAILAGIVLAYAVGWWNGSADAWRSPKVPFPPPAAIPHEDPGGYARNLLRAAAWIEARDHAGDIVDCVPGSMLLVMPDDPRIPHEVGDRLCKEGLRAAKAGTWLTASRHREYRSPSTPDPVELVRSGAWKLVRGFDRGREITGEPLGVGAESAIYVLEAVGR